jgi:hypothetical protein
MRFIGKLFFVLGILFLFFQISLAHVGYVVPESERERFAGDDFYFFYFGKEVYSHVTLFSLLSVLFVTGRGKISIDSIFAKSINEN